MPTHPAPTHAFGGLPDVPGLCPADTLALLQTGTRPPAAGPPAEARLLEGRHLAIVVAGTGDPSAEVFIDAARALGASLARISPDDLALEDVARAADTARLLGRLYAVVGCAGLGPRSVAVLRHACGVPVLDDLAAAAHPSRLLADVMTLKQAWRNAEAGTPARPRLGVYGPARSALLRAWKNIGAASGVDVVDLSAPGAAAAAAALDFVCRPGQPPELLALGAHGATAGPREALLVSLAAQQRCNHSLVVQALLRKALGSPAALRLPHGTSSAA